MVFSGLTASTSSVDGPSQRDSAVVGVETDGVGARVHAVLLLDEPAQAEAIVRDANASLAGHQQIRGWSVWPDEDFPRTPSLKVKRARVVEDFAGTVDALYGAAVGADA